MSLVGPIALCFMSDEFGGSITTSGCGIAGVGGGCFSSWGVLVVDHLVWMGLSQVVPL